MLKGSRYILVCFFPDGNNGFHQETVDLEAHDGREAVQQAKSTVGDLMPQSFEVRAVIRNVQMVIYRSGIRGVA